jgi:hypothetical protein
VKVTAKCAAAGAGLFAIATACALPAAAAPSEASSSASATVDQLQSEGYRVILSKNGSRAIDDCTVRAVRPGTNITSPQQPTSGNLIMTGPNQVLHYTTVYVDLDC